MLLANPHKTPGSGAYALVADVAKDSVRPGRGRVKAGIAGGQRNDRGNNSGPSRVNRPIHEDTADPWELLRRLETQFSRCSEHLQTQLAHLLRVILPGGLIGL